MVQDIIDGVIGGLTDFLGSIGASILDFIFDLITTFLNIVITPLNVIISSIFPNFSSFIETFNNGLAMLASSPIGFIAYHIPPITSTIILMYLNFMIGYYTILWTYRGIIIIPTVLHKIKFW